MRYDYTLSTSDSFVELSSVEFDTPRYKKEVLRVGKWNAQGHELNITKDILKTALDSHRKMMNHGVCVPFIWNHKAHEARDRIGDVIDLELSQDGEKLFAIVTAPLEEDARRLKKVNKEVSVRLEREWQDGSFNKYPYAITHIGAVNSPVVAKQTDGFVTLSLIEEQKPMGNESTPVEETTENTGIENGDATSMEVSEVKELLKMAAGLEFPPEVDTKKELMIAVKMALNPPGSSSAESEQTQAVELPVDAASDMSLVTLPKAKELLRQVQMQNKQLQDQVAADRSRRLSEAEKTFDLSLTKLMQEGRVNPSQQLKLKDAGKASGFNLSLLEPFEGLPATNLSGSRTQQLASTPQKDYSSMTKEERAAHRKEIWGN